MTRPRVYKTEAVVLGEVRLGEADRLVTLYTLRRGKVRAVARGALRPRSRLAGHLQPLCHCQLMLAEGRGMDTVAGCQIVNPFLPLRQDLMRQAWGFYLMELMDAFCPEGVESAPLFRLLRDTLEQLCQKGDGERVLRHFEVGLLYHAGFRPELHRCLGCGQPLEPVANYLSPSAGGLLCPRCAPAQPPTYPLSANAVKVLRLLQEADMDTFNRLRLSAALTAEIEAALKGYIQFVLERRVESRSWLERVRREVGTGGLLQSPPTP